MIHLTPLEKHLRPEVALPSDPTARAHHLARTRGLYWPAEGPHSELFRARFPDQRKLLRMADLASRRIIRHWHPWHMEITHRNYRLPKAIDWFTPPDGDHEWIESLVRFYHMIDLAAAWRLTGRGRYARAFGEYILSFNAARQSRGRHWQYKLNPAIRVINLIRAYSLFDDPEALPAEVHLAVHRSLLADMEFLLPLLPEGTGNGTFFVTTALLIGARFLAQSFDTDAWQAAAGERLEEILVSEIQPDGIEVEQVPMYHGEVLLTLLDYAIMLRANQAPIPASLERTAQRMLEALLQISDPQGRIPPIGDSDRQPVAYLQHLYERLFDTPVTPPPPPEEGRFQLLRLENTQWVVVRWRDDHQGLRYLLFDASGKPAPGLSGHSHADDLQFLVHDEQGPLLTDPGRFTYCTEFKRFLPFTRRRIHPQGRYRPLYQLLFPDFMALAERDWRRHFVHALAHNVVTLDGQNLPGYGDRWQKGPEVKLQEARNHGPLALLEATLDSGTLAAPGQEHRHQRLLVGLHPDVWMIVDRLEASTPHRWNASYHFGSDCHVEPAGDHLRIGRPGAPPCRFVHQAANAPWELEKDWVSEWYNEKRPAWVVRIHGPEGQRWQSATALCYGTDSKPKVELEQAEAPIQGSGTAPLWQLTITRGDRRGWLLVNPEGQPLEWRGIAFDARVAFIEWQGETPIRAAFLDGRRLHVGDRRLATDPRGDVHHLFRHPAKDQKSK